MVGWASSPCPERSLVGFPVGSHANIKLGKKEGKNCRATSWAVEKSPRVGTVPGLCLGPGSRQVGSSDRVLHPTGAPGWWPGESPRADDMRGPEGTAVNRTDQTLVMELLSGGTANA